MTNLEQAKRLKAAGVPQSNCKYNSAYYVRGILAKPEENHFRGVDGSYLYPNEPDKCRVIDEKEMMEFIAGTNYFEGICFDNCKWHIKLYKYEEIEIINIDLTEALVQACCRVAEGNHEN
jgi:hypothetical protein